MTEKSKDKESKEEEGTLVSPEQETLEKYSLKNKVKNLTSKILTKLPLKNKKIRS